MSKHYKENWKAYHFVFIVITVLVSFPDVIGWKTPGLDPSWRFALNELFCDGYICGEDFVFTYGPFGFLVNCVKTGHNILITCIFWIFMLGAHSILLFQLLFKNKERGRQRTLTFVGLSLFLISYPSAEYYIVYICLLSVLLTITGYKQDIYFSVLLLPVSLYIKFSLFILIAAIMMIYLILGYFQDKILYRYCVPRICLGVVLMPLIYFVFNRFSLKSFKKFIKGSIEMASGYSSAMSTSQHDLYIIWIIIAAIACAICLILSARCGIQCFMVLSFISVCLLMLYKHGFVRADNIHVPSCMNAMLTFLSLAVIFLDWNHILAALGKWKRLFMTMFTIVLSIVMVQNGLESINIISSIKKNIFEFPVKIADIFDQKATDVSPLPPSVAELIGDSTVCIYPWEISYCISTELNYIPLTTLQAYCAYTPYLDRITAEKFLSEDAPKHIILTLDTIDSRWPFIECPQTWEAIRNNYLVLIEDNGIILLQHNAYAQPVLYKSLGRLSQNKEDEIVLENADFLKITAELNWKGKLAKMFWKIPEVNMTVYYADENATVETGRVLLDLFSEGIEVGSIISHNNIEQLVDMINHEGNLSTVNSICFSGDGLAFYKNNISIEFFTTSKNR